MGQDERQSKRVEFTRKKKKKGGKKSRWVVLMVLQKNIKCCSWSKEAASVIPSFHFAKLLILFMFFFSFLFSESPTEPNYITQAASRLGFSLSISLPPARWKRPSSSLARQQGRLLTRHTKFRAGILRAGNQNPSAVCSAPVVCGRVLLDNHGRFQEESQPGEERETDGQICLLHRIF